MSYFVLATKDKTARPSAWNVYENIEAAEKGRLSLPPDESSGDYEILTPEEFYARQDAFYLGQKIAEITLDEYQDMLGMLPPLHWERVGRVERFLMGEFLEASFTRQYAKLGNRCFMKIVDADKPSSWIDEAVIDEFDQRP